MPRLIGSPETTSRWNKSDDAKFRTQVDSGIIDIDDVTPKSIESVRTTHGWDNRTKLNFRINYRRVAGLLRLARDLQGARVSRKKGK